MFIRRRSTTASKMRAVRSSRKAKSTRWELDDWMKTLPQPWTTNEFSGSVSRLCRNLGPSVTENRADIFLQSLFHILFGFFEIASRNCDTQLDTGSLPAVIFGPERALYGNRSDYGYGDHVRLHDYLLSV
jgi:hypothetical protein